MSSLQKALNEEVQKQEEQKLAEKIFVSMMGNSSVVETMLSNSIIDTSIQLAKEFKDKCRGEYDQ